MGNKEETLDKITEYKNKTITKCDDALRLIEGMDDRLFEIGMVLYLPGISSDPVLYIDVGDYDEFVTVLRDIKQIVKVTFNSYYVCSNSLHVTYISKGFEIRFEFPPISSEDALNKISDGKCSITTRPEQTITCNI